MSLPIMLRSAMTGAPSFNSNNASLNALLLACLVDGFNTKAPTSASSTGSVVSLVYATDPGFTVGSTIAISGATNALYNGNFRVVTTGTTVTVANTSGPAGSVAGTLSTKYAPLGWTRPYSAAGTGCYRQGGTAAHKRYWRVYDNTMVSSSQFFVRGYEAMTAVSTGTGPFPTTAQVAGNGTPLTPSVVAAPGVSAWCIVGTPRAFYLMFDYATDATGNLDTFSTSGTLVYFFGELGGLFNAGDTYAQLAPVNWSIPGSHYFARAYTGVIGAVISSTWGCGGNGYTSIGVASPNPGGGDIITGGPILVCDTGNTAVRGYFPGILGMVTTPAYSGFVPNLSITPSFPGITGRVMHFTSYGVGSGGEITYLLDEDWGDV